jgi:hypothetical protein
VYEEEAWGNSHSFANEYSDGKEQLNNLIGEQERKLKRLLRDKGSERRQWRDLRDDETCEESKGNDTGCDVLVKSDV